jgi:uncharacterized protein
MGSRCTAWITHSIKDFWNHLKFLCDQMLADVGKWLRIAGYDTEIINHSEKDDEIYARALREDRLLLTRDQYFIDKPRVVYLQHNPLDDCIRELNTLLPINWLFNPLSRCPVCNAPLEQARPELIQEQAPTDVIENGSAFRYCSSCIKIYWEGSHTQKMMAQLKRFQNL